MMTLPMWNFSIFLMTFWGILKVFELHFLNLDPWNFSFKIISQIRFKNIHTGVQLFLTYLKQHTCQYLLQQNLHFDSLHINSLYYMSQHFQHNSIVINCCVSLCVPIAVHLSTNHSNHLLQSHPQVSFTSLLSTKYFKKKNYRTMLIKKSRDGNIF